MNLPNTITFVRVVLIPVFIGLMSYGYYRIALFVYVAACLTDALDGLIARLTNTKTELGAFLDPMADKLLIVTSFVTLALLGNIPAWLVIIVISRDVILLLGGSVIHFTGRRLIIQPSVLGKITTFCQLLVVTATLVLIAYGVKATTLFQGAYWLTAGVTIASGVQYIHRGMRLMA